MAWYGIVPGWQLVALPLFTLLGGLQWLSTFVLLVTGPGMGYQTGLLVAYALASGIIDLPFEYYEQALSPLALRGLIRLFLPALYQST